MAMSCFIVIQTYIKYQIDSSLSSRLQNIGGFWEVPEPEQTHEKQEPDKWKKENLV